MQQLALKPTVFVECSVFLFDFICTESHVEKVQHGIRVFNGDEEIAYKTSWGKPYINRETLFIKGKKREKFSVPREKIMKKLKRGEIK